MDSLLFRGSELGELASSWVSCWVIRSLSVPEPPGAGSPCTFPREHRQLASWMEGKHSAPWEQQRLANHPSAKVRKIISVREEVCCHPLVLTAQGGEVSGSCPPT